MFFFAAFAPSGSKTAAHELNQIRKTLATEGTRKLLHPSPKIADADWLTDNRRGLLLSRFLKSGQSDGHIQGLFQDQGGRRVAGDLLHARLCHLAGAGIWDEAARRRQHR